MSAPSRSDADIPVLDIPNAWQQFLSSGEYARARAAIKADSSEVLVDLIARAEFVDERHLEIHLTLAEDVSSARDATRQALVDLLTARERAVIALIAMGYETRELADALHISPATVRTHVRNSMTKLGAHTRAQLVAVAMDGHEPVEIAHSDDGVSDKYST
jgi:DNA-binding NarL/FixJ family response regulator